MKICEINRTGFYELIAAAFKVLSTTPVIAELGVLRGANAEQLYDIIKPRKMYLVDGWTKDITSEYSRFDPLPSWMDPLETYSSYYGGSLYEQSTYDRIYEECLARFADHQNVTVIREKTPQAFPFLVNELANEKLDLLYVDASHQYENVLYDLLTYQELVQQEGCIILNDCCHSQLGIKQNLGVLEAVGSFIKRSNFIPVALTNTDWSDLILVRKGSQIGQLIDYILSNSDVPFVEIPPQLLPAAKIKQGAKRINISFL